MNRQDRNHDEGLNRLFQLYQDECEQFAKATSGVFNPVHRWYRGDKTDPDQFSKQDIVIDYGAFELVFTYHFFPSVQLLSRSVIKLDLLVTRPDYRAAVPMDILMNHLNPNDFTPFVFQDIHDPTVMNDVFMVYADWFERYRSDLDALCEDEDRFKDMIQDITQDFTRLFGPTKGINNQQYVSFLINKTRHFIRPPYQLFLLGDYEKSLKQYQRIQGSSFEYERRIMDLMETRLAIEGYEPKCLVPDSVARTYRYHRLLSLSPRMAQTLLSFLAAVILSVIILGSALIALMGLVYVIVSAQSVYASPLRWEFAMIGALSASILLAYQFKTSVHKFLFKNDHDLYVGFERLYTSKKDARLFRGFSIFFVSVGIIVSMLFGADILSLRNTTFTVSTLMDDFSLFNQYEYSDLDRIEYRSTWINGFGEEIDSPNYTLVFKDGSEISLLPMASVDDVEREVIPILIERNITIIQRNP